MHSKGKNVLWIPYYDDNKKLEKIQEYARKSFVNGTPIIDTIIIQPGAFYGKDVESINEVKDVVSKFNNDPDVLTRVGLEMEFDMGLVTGRKDNNMDIFNKRTIFQEYLNTLPELKEMNVPIGVYSGGPNEQGYRDIWNNTNTHNSGNHIPYWEGIDESAEPNANNPNPPETAQFRYLSVCHLCKAPALLHLPHQNLLKISSVSGRRIFRVRIFGCARQKRR